MRARWIPPQTGGDGATLAGLISVVGTSDFSKMLFGAATAWAQPEHLTAFMMDEGERPRMVLAENAGANKVAENLAGRYCSEFFRHDLANRQQIDIGERGWILRTNASEIAQADYRHCCYTAVKLDDRISLCDTRKGHTLRINLYRRTGHAFREDDVGRIEQTAAVLLALVRKHAEQCAPHRPHSHAYYRDRLVAAVPALTPREADVCAAIIRGVTSEGIALELGIGMNTVLTYKKRAYARLNISSQNQLMRIVLN